MKKLVFIAFLFSANLSFAQECINFDTRFINCINKWVVLPQNNDLPYTYGYVFFDDDFALTFQRDGIFEVGEECNFYPEKLYTKRVVKRKLLPSDTLVSIVTEEKMKELHISDISNSPKNTKKTKETAERYFNLGYLYNEWGECEKALEFLQQATDLNPKINGLEREKAFAYNSLGEYEKAIEILNLLRKKSPKNAYIFRELIFAQARSGKIEEAAKNCKKAISVCKDKQYNGENCLNVLHQYFAAKDSRKFQQWLKRTKRWNKGNEKAIELIEDMEEDLLTNK